MGNIAFDIFQTVELDKTVELNITKDVFINVNNPDHLATAEADAEAFGLFALAEVLGADDFSGFDSETGTGINGLDGVPDPIFMDLSSEGGQTPPAALDLNPMMEPVLI